LRLVSDSVGKGREMRQTCPNPSKDADAVGKEFKKRGTVGSLDFSNAEEGEGRGRHRAVGGAQRKKGGQTNYNDPRRYPKKKKKKREGKRDYAIELEEYVCLGREKKRGRSKEEKRQSVFSTMRRRGKKRKKEGGGDRLRPRFVNPHRRKKAKKGKRKRAHRHPQQSPAPFPRQERGKKREKNDHHNRQ